MMINLLINWLDLNQAIALGMLVISIPAFVKTKTGKSSKIKTMGGGGEADPPQPDPWP